MSETLIIYALTHKKFVKPSIEMYVPLQVGAALHNDLGYMRDDTGDNISEKNIYYSELTGLYWIWKNVRDADYVGTCHYRRYLIDENEQIYDKEQMHRLLQQYDIITTKRVMLNNSYRDGFAANHNVSVLDVTGEVIRDIYPEDYNNYISLVNGNLTHFSNMLVTKKSIYDEYCHWLFSIFEEVEKRVDLNTDEDAYHKRILGFISEFLLGVWIAGRGYSTCECKVGVISEKKEVTEVKARIAAFFEAGDWMSAKDYLLDAMRSRPDIMHEMADITGELHIAMQIISTCEFEYSATGKCLLDEVSSLESLVKYIRNLNRAVLSGDNVDNYSEQAVYVAKAVQGIE